MKKILCSTGCFVGMPNNRDYHKIIEIAPRLNCDAFELMIYDTWYPYIDTVASDLKLSGIPFCTVHIEKHIGELIAQGDEEGALALFEVNCRVASEVKAKLLIMHIWNGNISDSRMDLCIKAYPKLNAIAKSYGLVLTIENVVCWNNTPMKNLHTLASVYHDIAFTFDTKMAQFHDELCSAFDEENKVLWQNNVKHIHVNDYAGGYMTWDKLRIPQISEGKVDFEWFFDKLKGYDYQGDFTLEAASLNKDGFIDIAGLNGSIKKVRELLEK